jgi:multiple antibiotic resistance protein
MPENLLQFILTAFVMLIVVVNPVAVAPVFVSLTEGMENKERSSVLFRSLIISFLVLLFFLLIGRTFLAYLGVNMYAFTISGGILLFGIAYGMLFGSNKKDSKSAKKAGNTGEDVAIFPMAIPMLAGPSTILSVLVLGAQAEGNVVLQVSILLTIVAVYIISWAILAASGKLMRLMGESKVNVITRVLGIILTALAVQFVLNGITTYYQTLIAS